MIGALFLLHRYLGILFGVLVTLWCLSAFVMMYIRYPALTDGESLAALDRLDLSGCCRPVGEMLDAGTPVRSFRIEAVARKPVLLLETELSRPVVIALSSGTPTTEIDVSVAREQAARYFANAGVPGLSGSGKRIERDQWTVSGGFDLHRPLYRFRGVDSAGSEIYVSGVTGEVVQQTTARERFWNWFGSVVHWLYPVVLREHPKAWQQTVIWTSMAGIFLVVTGLYIGLRQYRSGRSGRSSPYRGATRWHHCSGLIFGVLTLTWLGSGLLSVNPWGLLQSESARADHRRLAGAAFAPDDLPELLSRLRRFVESEEVVRIESAAFAGKLAILAYTSSGDFTRLDPLSLARMPVSRADLQKSAAALSSASAPVASAGMMVAEDSYYFSHHDPVELPVYRVLLDDAARTRFYIHPETGRLLLKVDGNRRWYRWLFEGLHRGDFLAQLRRRPLWDFMLLSLLIGVTISALTGTYLGIRRLLRTG